MRKLIRFLHLQDYDLSGDYLRAVGKEWEAILWGESLPAIGFIIWVAFGHPSGRAYAAYFIVALLIAGYFVWRADHVRLMPQLEIGNLKVQRTPMVNPATQAVVGKAYYVQLPVSAKTGAGVESCQGHLLRVEYKPTTDGAQWQATEVNESLPLGWSLSGGQNAITLLHGVPKNLNVCHLDSTDSAFLVPAVAPLPARAREVMVQQGTFRFIIRITAKDAATLDAVVECGHPQDWEKAEIRLVVGEQPK